MSIGSEHVRIGVEEGGKLIPLTKTESGTFEPTGEGTLFTVDEATEAIRELRKDSDKFYGIILA